MAFLAQESTALPENQRGVGYPSSVSARKHRVRQGSKRFQPGIIPPRTDVDLAVGDGGNGELYREASLIARDLGTVPELRGQLARIECMKDRGVASGGLRGAGRLRRGKRPAVLPYRALAGELQVTSCWTTTCGRSFVHDQRGKRCQAQPTSQDSLRRRVAALRKPQRRLPRGPEK